MAEKSNEFEPNPGEIANSGTENRPESPDQAGEDSPQLSVRAWQLMTEAKIQDAITKGDLPNAELGSFSGFGKPIAEIDQQIDAELKELRDNVEANDDRIPPAMKLRRDVAEGLLEIMRLENESEIPASVERLNDLIDDVKENLSWGPPITTTNLDLDTVIMRWRQVQQENQKNQQQVD